MLLLCIVIFCVTSFTGSQSQSVVGKWEGVSAQYFYSNDYAKQIGKGMEEKTNKEAGESQVEYKSDHTFTLSFSAPNSSEVTKMNGTWSVTGNELKMTLEPQYNPRRMTTTSTFSISGNIMVTTSVIPPPSRILKTIATSKRL